MRLGLIPCKGMDLEHNSTQKQAYEARIVQLVFLVNKMLIGPKLHLVIRTLQKLRDTKLQTTEQETINVQIPSFNN